MLQPVYDVNGYETGETYEDGNPPIGVKAGTQPVTTPEQKTFGGLTEEQAFDRILAGWTYDPGTDSWTPPIGEGGGGGGDKGLSTHGAVVDIKPSGTPGWDIWVYADGHEEPVSNQSYQQEEKPKTITGSRKDPDNPGWVIVSYSDGSESLEIDPTYTKPSPARTITNIKPSPDVPGYNIVTWSDGTQELVLARKEEKPVSITGTRKDPNNPGYIVVTKSDGSEDLILDVTYTKPDKKVVGTEKGPPGYLVVKYDDGSTGFMEDKEWSKPGVSIISTTQSSTPGLIEVKYSDGSSTLINDPGFQKPGKSIISSVRDSTTGYLRVTWSDGSQTLETDALAAQEREDKRLAMQLAESAADRGQRSADNAADRALRQALQSQQLSFTGKENALDRALQKEMQNANFEFQGDQNSLDRALKLEMQQIDISWEKEQQLEELKQRRAETYANMIGKDPIRAVLLALGASGPILPGGEVYESLPPLQGAIEQRNLAETGLMSLLGREDVPEQGVFIEPTGVYGLGPAAKSATAFQYGSSDMQRLLGSGFGIGALGVPQTEAQVSDVPLTLQGPQQSYGPEAYEELITSLTPKGVLGY